MAFYFITFQVTHMDWTGQNRAFIAETFIKNESVTATQKAFFGLDRHDPVPTQNSIFIMGYKLQSCWIKIAAIPHKMIHRVMDNFRKCLPQCFNNNGKHSTVVIFKTKKIKWPHV